MNASRGSDAGRLRAARVFLIVFCLSLAMSACEERAPRGPRICAPLGLGAWPTQPAPAPKVADGARPCACRAEQVAAAASLASTGAALGAIGTSTARAAPSHEDRRVRSARVRPARSSTAGQTRRKRRKALPRPVATPTQTQHACIDIRTADAAALEQLPGVGPSRAARIVELRAQRPFTRVRHLKRVRGIGPATLRKMRDQICPLE